MDFIDENSTLLKNAVCALGEIKSFKKNFHFYFKKKKEVTFIVVVKFLFFYYGFFHFTLVFRRNKKNMEYEDEI